jgi:uncharacterized membrane protein YbhN (UPF0104 family)
MRAYAINILGYFRNNKPIWYMTKWGLGMLVAILLYFQLNDKLGEVSHWTDPWTFIMQLNLGLVFVVFVLMFANWGLEIVKWKTVMESIGGVSWNKALKTILTGIYFSAFTPARSGDYFGRLWHVGRRDRSFAFFGTFLCSLAQVLVTIGLGTLGLLLLLNVGNTSAPFPQWITYSLPLVIALLLTLYLKADKWIIRFPRLLRNLRLLDHLKKGKVLDSQKLRIATLALVRYGVYVIQPVLLFYAAGWDLPFAWAVCGISILYLFQTVFPMPMILQLTTKTELALLIWAPFNPDPALILMCMLLIWMMNVILMAIPGFISFELKHERNT